jgi:hypothetical protein
MESNIRKVTKQMYHVFHDGSVLKKISVRELIGIPVWRGNRHIDMEHVKNIQNQIGDNIICFDSAVFRVVTYNDNDIQQRYIIDGQHRQKVIQSVFETLNFKEDFDVIVIEKAVEDETEAIDYFNQLNNVKPQFEHDSKLIVNKYIVALSKKFNTSKKNMLIRPEGKTTKRPFLSDSLLRSALEANSRNLKGSKECIDAFVEKVNIWNTKKIEELELQSLYTNQKDKALLEATLEKKFALAFDIKLPWIKECINSS